MQPEKQESTWLYEGLAWLELNRKLVIASLVVVLVVIVGAYIYHWNRRQAEVRANDALLALKPRTAADTGEKAAAAADFLSVAEQHTVGSTPERALILAAGELYRDGRYAEAQAAFQKARDHHPRGPLAASAALGIAASLDAQDQVDAALAAYQAVTRDYADSPASARAKFALKIYDELATAQKMGRASMEASVKRTALLKQHPELARSNAVVTLPPVNVLPNPDAAAGSAPAPTPATEAPATNKIAGQP
jgi:predicted negative regulator of RcsB-dependent stress response